MLGLGFLGLTQTLVLGEEGGSSGGLNLGLIQETHLPDADRVWPALWQLVFDLQGGKLGLARLGFLWLGYGWEPCREKGNLPAQTITESKGATCRKTT